MNSRRLLQELTDADGVPGWEGEVRQVLRRHLESVAFIEMDHLGCFLAQKGGDQAEPRVMLAAHMDEVGFMVKSVTSDGFLKFTPLGGWWDQVLLAQRVRVKGRKGDVPGLIGSKPPHVLEAEERKQLVKRKEMFIDIGAQSAQEVEKFGVRPGDPIIPHADFVTLKNSNLLMAKAWDDRLGCGLLIEVFQDLVKLRHPNTVYGVGTVQEEVGTRGAATSVEIVNPHVAIILEVSIASDMPGLKEECSESLGKGPTICLYDASLIPNIKLRDLCIDVATDNRIPYQFTVMEGGGTDGGRIHLHHIGVPTLVIGVPVRYIHSHYGIMHLDDYKNARKLVSQLIQHLDAETVRGLTL